MNQQLSQNKSLIEGGSKGRGYMYIPMADSCWGLTKATKFCKAIILQKKLIKKKTGVKRTY